MTKQVTLTVDPGITVDVETSLAGTIPAVVVPHRFVEDLAPFFDPAMFGETAVVNGNVAVNGLMDLAYADPLGNLLEGSAPVFTCAEIDVGSLAHGTSLAVSGKNYKVVGVEPDGTGVVRLRLERQ